jgi:hypothetical protein
MKGKLAARRPRLPPEGNVREKDASSTACKWWNARSRPYLAEPRSLSLLETILKDRRKMNFVALLLFGIASTTAPAVAQRG